MKKIWILSSLIMILVTLYQINTTYAKYYTEASGKAEAAIGAWIVRLNNSDITTGTAEQTFVIDNINTYNTDNVLNGKIAPGAIGYFDIVIDATDASVAVKYEVTVEENNTQITDSMKVYKVVEVVDGQEVETAITKTGEKTYTGIVDLADIKADKTNTVRILLEWQEDDTGINDERD